MSEEQTTQTTEPVAETTQTTEPVAPTLVEGAPLEVGVETQKAIDAEQPE